MTNQRGRGRVARGGVGGGRGTKLAAARPGLVEGEVDERPVSARPAADGVTPLAWLRAELAAVLAQRPQAAATGAHLRAFLGELAGLEDAEQLRVDLGVLKALVATVAASLDRDDPHALEAIHQWLATLAAEGPLDMTDARDAGPSALLDEGRDGRESAARPLPVPVSPVMLAALQGIYAGGPTTHWTVDEAGRPQYRYEARGGHITLFFESEPQGVEAVAAVWEAVRDLSVETADVFLILMSRIAELPDPRRDIARIRLDEIAEYRAVRRRRGTLHRLYEDFTREVLRLAELRLTMVWQDYRGRGTVAFGKPRPDHLLDIVGVELTRDGETWTAFGFRCGQALAHFLTPNDLRWVGHYARALLELNPRQEALVKKIGTYWVLIGTIAGKKGQAPRATIRTILAFCGEEPNWERPGRTVDAVIEVHQRLQEIGLLDELPALEPPNRHKGFFRGWLDTPVSVRLSEDIWKISQAPDRARLPSPRKRRLPRRESAGQQPLLPLGIPDGPGQLQSDPALIRRFRMLYNVQQAELASALGITRESLSRYERQVRPLPDAAATHILALWRQKAGL